MTKPPNPYRDDLPYDDPWQNLIYWVIKRGCLDAKGIDLCLRSDERSHNNPGRLNKIYGAREWIHEDDNSTLSFGSFCDSLGFDTDGFRKRIPKPVNNPDKPVVIKPKKLTTYWKTKKHNKRLAVKTMADSYNVVNQMVLEFV